MCILGLAVHSAMLRRLVACTRSWRFGRPRDLLRCGDLLLNSHAALRIHRRLAKRAFLTS